MRGSLFQIITFIGLTAFQEEKEDLTLQLRKTFSINHNLVDLLCLVLIRATVVCIKTGNSEVLLAVVRKSPAHS
jgi:hypothetical protein